MTRAQEAEETYALKNNLSTTKQKLVDTTRKLEEANTLIGDIKHRVSIQGFWSDPLVFRGYGVILNLLINVIKKLLHLLYHYMYRYMTL